MTKILAFLLSLVLFVSPAFAVGIDVCSLTDDDLSFLYESVIEEMNRRGAEYVGEIYPGTYVVGTDILPGKYIIQYFQNDSPLRSANILVYANQTDYDNMNQLTSTNLYDYYELYLDLQEGMVILLREASVSIRIAPIQSPFWAVKK